MHKIEHSKNTIKYGMKNGLRNSLRIKTWDGLKKNRNEKEFFCNKRKTLFKVADSCEISY